MKTSKCNTYTALPKLMAKNKNRTVNKILKFPIDSHKIPCYTIYTSGFFREWNLKKTFLFMDTISNKVDAKGRVSLPADYRAIAKELNSEIVCYRSLTSPCIEGCLEELLEKLAVEIENATDFFSETQDNLTNLIFGDAKRFTFDSTGRIVLTEKLLNHAQISDNAVFVGKGRKFQIWNPENWAEEEKRIRNEAMKNRPVLNIAKSGDNK